MLKDEKLLVGFDTSDDGAVYQLSPELAIIKTLDFFGPLVDDPYVFGQIAACNALSDIAAMGGTPLIALNILAFPEDIDMEYLEAMLVGGAEKAIEAGCVLCGGHSIGDKTLKYGLSVTGTVHPKRILYNNKSNIGDKIILTKPLGVGIVAARFAAGEASEDAYNQAVASMTTLNTHTMNIAKNFQISAATDVTGFGFLGHLNEMAAFHTVVVNSADVPYIQEAYDIAAGGFATGGGKKNRNHVCDSVDFGNTTTAKQEIMLDPQTSGGLLLSINPSEVDNLLAELGKSGINAAVVAEVVPRRAKNICII